MTNLLKNIPTIDKIYASKWWEEAAVYPDRHYPPGSGKILTSHLIAVLENTGRIFDPESANQFYRELYSYLLGTGFELARCREVLRAVSLLHDLGKPHANKEEEIEHPLRKIAVPRRHPLMGVCAAIEILENQQDFSDEEKQLIYNLIDEHDTSFSWYRQYEKTNHVPEYKSWKKLDHKISPGRDDHYGIIMLALFKLADIEGHPNISDLFWFWENLNDKYLAQAGRPLPIPLERDIR